MIARPQSAIPHSNTPYIHDHELVKIIREVAALVADYDGVLSPDTFLEQHQPSDAAKTLMTTIESHRDMLDALCKDFYMQYAMSAVLRDRPLYTVMFHILLCRPLPEAVLNRVHFDPGKIAILIRYLYSDSTDQIVYKYFDQAWAECNMIGPLRQAGLDAWADLTLSPDAIAKRRKAQHPTKTPITVTKPKPFLLAERRPSPSSIEDAVRIDTRPKPANPVPRHILGLCLNEIMAEKENRRRQRLHESLKSWTVIHQHLTARFAAPKPTPQEPVLDLKVTSKLIARPATRIGISTAAPEIAWCRAAILRETYQTQARQRRLAKAIEQYEYGGLDDYDFQCWKREGEAEDEQRRADAIRARKCQLQKERQAVKDVMEAAFRCRKRDARRSDQHIQLMLNARKQHNDLMAAIKKQVVATICQQKRSSS